MQKGAADSGSVAPLLGINPPLSDDDLGLTVPSAARTTLRGMAEMSLLAGLFLREWLHPGGSGYWFYSGVFDAGILVGILSGIGVYWRAHNCHVQRCWRLDWHPHPDHGHPVCFLHHPEGGAEFLHARHHQVKVSTKNHKTSESAS